MEYDEIGEMWSKDSDIDIDNIAEEVRRTPKLHTKYYDLLIRTSMQNHKLEAKKKQLMADKYDYYSGTMDIEDIKQRGWKPLPKMIIRQDVQRYVEADDEVIELTLKIAYKKSIVEYLERILKMIENRGYNLKLIFDYTRYRGGG